MIGLIVNIGNITIEPGFDDYAPCEIKKNEYWENVIKLSKITDENSFIKYMTSKATFVKGDNATFSHQKFSDCVNKRDVLARMMYYDLFNWLAGKTSSPPEDNTISYHSLCIMDFSGFENLENNTLEQLLVNYGNEKLTYEFQKSTFLEEKSTFDAENLEHLAQTLIEPKAELILSLLDNERPSGILQIIEKTSINKKEKLDRILLANFVKFLKNNELFIKNDDHDDNEFGIKHTASNVTYNVNTFNEKYKDDFPTYITKYFTSINAKIFDIFRTKNIDETQEKHWTKKGYSSKYKFDINNIIQFIKEKTKTYYIKCIMPNSEKAKGKWDDSQVIRQVNSLGIESYIRFKKL